jgi:Undecaprenyl-phosphate galactose phosphotransferase WbaP
MSEIGSVLSQDQTPVATLDRNRLSHEGSRKAARAAVVATSLMCGDILSASVAGLTVRPSLSLPFAGQGHDERTSIVLLILIFGILGLYTGRGPAPPERFRSRTIGIGCFVAIQIGAMAFTTQWPVTFLAIAIEAIALLTLGHYVECIIRSALIRLRLWGAPTILLGFGERSRSLATLLLDQPSIGLTPIGFSDRPFDRGSKKFSAFSPIGGPTADKSGVQYSAEVVIATSARDLALATLHNREATPRRYLLVEDESDLNTLWVRTRTLGGRLGVEVSNGLCLPRNRLFKRVIDLCIAIPMAGLTLPIIVALALLIKIVDPGPAFYVQTRIGLNGQPLRVFKLRSMYKDAEQRLAWYLRGNERARAEWNRFYKLANDPRILPTIGAFIRRASLDELPQIWNVIRGDMSLVGPRPFPAYHIKAFDEDFRELRMSVLPGITGMWQVSSRSEGDLRSQRAQDSFYIRNWSIWLDIYILLETLPAVLTAKGAK